MATTSKFETPLPLLVAAAIIWVLLLILLSPFVGNEETGDDLR
jgi:hypothetical protein